MKINVLVVLLILGAVSIVGAMQQDPEVRARDMATALVDNNWVEALEAAADCGDVDVVDKILKAHPDIADAIGVCRIVARVVWSADITQKNYVDVIERLLNFNSSGINAVIMPRGLTPLQLLANRSLEVTPTNHAILSRLVIIFFKVNADFSGVKRIAVKAGNTLFVDVLASALSPQLAHDDIGDDCDDARYE